MTPPPYMRTKTIHTSQLNPRYYHEHEKQQLLSKSMSESATEDIIDYDDDDSEARSQFGTRQYWDDMYIGMGDFSQEEYSWYYSWDTVKPYFTKYVPPPPPSKSLKSEFSNIPKILIPGIGNDGILLDLYSAGYTNITAFDYSANAIDRQHDLLYTNPRALKNIDLYVKDARNLNETNWIEKFDVIFEKGALDAIYLSGDGNVEMAVQEFTSVLKVGGIFMSVSGVVPEELRRELFPMDQWEWIRDGSDDLKAGYFVWKRTR